MPGSKKVIKLSLLAGLLSAILFLAFSFYLYNSQARVSATTLTGNVLGDNTSNFALIKCGVGQSLTQGADAVWTCSDNPIDQITASNGITKSGNSLSLITCPAGQIIKSDGTTYQCSSDLTGDSSSTSSNSYTASNGIVLQGTNLSPNYGTTANTIAQGNDSRFHDPLTIGTGNGLSLANQVLSLGLASSTQNGALSSSDWNSFNNKVSSQWANYNTGIQYNSGTVMVGNTLASTSSIPYNASTLTGAATSLSLGADSYSSEISLPFTFKLYDTSYNSLWIDSNGYVTFTQGYTDSYLSNPLPDPSSPHAMIAGFLSSLDPTAGGTIKYETLGTTPNRVFVIEFKDIHMSYYAGIVNFQIKLFESTDNVEIHTLSITNPDGDGYNLGTQGIQNEDGTKADFIVGRNNTEFTLNNDGVRFKSSSSELADLGNGSLVIENKLQTDSLQSGTIDTNSVYKIGGQVILQNEGIGNLFAGVGSGYNNSIYGAENTFIGFRSGYNNTDGQANTLVGYNSGQKNTTGFANTFLGSQSGQNNTTGIANSFIGNQSGFSNTTGNYNSFLGNGSGGNNTTGSYNSFLGDGSGIANTVGSQNIFIGNGSGGNNTTGNYNSFLGNGSGGNNTTGSYNSFLGNGSGRSSTTGSYNLYLGPGTGSAFGSGTLSSSIGIGYNTVITASNQLVIGSNDTNGSITDSYWGNGVTKTSTPNNFAFNATGGSGTDIAGASLLFNGGRGTGTGIGGDLIFQTAKAAVGSGSSQNSLSERFRITSTGAVSFATSGGSIDFASSSNGNTFIEKIPQKATNGTCASAASEGLIFQNTGGTQVGHMCISGPTAGSPDKLAFYADSFNATSTDLAENYSDKDNSLSSGDIVILDDLTSKGVKKASQTGDSLLLGIVSTDPGLKLSGIEEDGKTDLVNPKAIALSGRVPVKVSSKNGSIKKGDLITSSDIPGVGQKATGSGFVVGKALEDYTEIDINKVGKILVFINLTYFSPGQILTSQDVDTVLSEKYTALETRVTNLEAKVEDIEQKQIAGDAKIQDIEDKQLSGEIIFKAGETEVKVNFDKSYTNIPNVVLTPNSNLSGAYYYIDSKTTKGFIVKLSAPQKTEVKFDWLSLVKE